VGANIINHNDQVACKLLINFIHLACTRNASRDTFLLLACLALAVPLDNEALIQHHHTKLIAYKLPGLTALLPWQLVNRLLRVSENLLLNNARLTRTWWIAALLAP
jgi:hypothetical protein